MKYAMIPCLLLCLAACGSSKPDARSADVLVDAAPDVADATAAPDASPSCKLVPFTEAAVDTTRKKFAMSLMHFNVEYVIGGLEYTMPDGSKKLFLDNAKDAGWDNDKVEDYIIEETFFPILEMYDKHPGWGVNIELQAYMIEVMAARHPQVLDLLRKLAQRGQVELVSFHWAAQLFLAFPKEDLHRSLERVREVFAKHCLPLSPVVFNQEGQAGEGRQKMLVEEGYQIGVFPKNLWRYVREQGDNFWPLYSSEGGDLIVGPGGVDPASGIQVAWNFLDDGELAASPKTAAGPANPYFAPTAPHDPARVAAFEQELENTEKQGFFMARISDYVRHLKAEKIEVKPAPLLLDGTWQAPSTSSIHRWLGGRGFPMGLEEADNLVRAGNMEARTHVAALQLMRDVLTQQGKPIAGLDAALRKLWEDVWHAEVSDCTGVNPWYGEVHFGLDLNAKILADCKTWRDKVIPAFGKAHVHVDLAKKTVTAIDALPMVPALTSVDAPLDVTLTTAGRATEIKWFTLGDNRWAATVNIGASTCGEDCDASTATLSFPRMQDFIEYSPALIEDAVRSYPIGDFKFVQKEVWLPLANGVIGLGNGWYVVKRTRTVHIAARVAPLEATIQFVDETLRETDSASWQFVLVKGTAADALALGDTFNLHPALDY